MIVKGSVLQVEQRPYKDRVYNSVLVSVDGFSTPVQVNVSDQEWAAFKAGSPEFIGSRVALDWLLVTGFNQGVLASRGSLKLAK